MSVASSKQAFALEHELAKLDPGERGAAAAFLAAHPPGAGAPLAIVIPAYNEEPTVAEVVAEIPSRGRRARRPRRSSSSTAPRTRPRPRRLAGGALVCDVPVNRGQGAALRLGYWLARARGAQVICTIDADGQYEPDEIAPRGRSRSSTASADFVSGSRRLGAELTTDKVRHAGVLVFGALISVLVRHRITDPACGLRAMRSEVTASGHARAAPVPGVRADDQRRAERLPAGRGADDDARPRRPRHARRRRAGTSATACGSRAPPSTPGGATAGRRARGSDPRRSSAGRGRT